MLYHKIYEEFECIENEVTGIILIPLFKKYNKLVGYAISNLSLKNKLLVYKYHTRIFGKENFYAISNNGISMHEIVMEKNPPKGLVIDHINGQGLYNTEENLHHATYGLNSQNRPYCGSISKYIGVSKKNKSKWTSQICINTKSIHLGSFDNEIDAAKIYDVYAIHYYKNNSPKTNELLTAIEISDIINNGIPIQYQKISRDLPDNISLSKNGTYSVEIVYLKTRFCKRAKTLEDAILMKNNFYEEIRQNKLKLITEITRDENGFAIIYAGNNICIVDDDHWHDVNQYKWHCFINKNGKLKCYPSAVINDKIVLLHRYIYEKYVGPITEGMTVDHINCTMKFDVRLKNLRLADASLQNHNRNMPKNILDEYNGVIFRGNKYEVSVLKKNYGSYESAEEAAAKANEIYFLKYGDNAKLNIIDFSKRTTKYNRIPEKIIDKEYILNISSVIDLVNVIEIKKLDYKNKGPIATSYIKYNNMDKYKKIIIDKLYS